MVGHDEVVSQKGLQQNLALRLPGNQDHQNQYNEGFK